MGNLTQMITSIFQRMEKRDEHLNRKEKEKEKQKEKKEKEKGKDKQQEQEEEQGAEAETTVAAENDQHSGESEIRGIVETASEAATVNDHDNSNVLKEGQEKG